MGKKIFKRIIIEIWLVLMPVKGVNNPIRRGFFQTQARNFS